MRRVAFFLALALLGIASTRHASAQYVDTFNNRWYNVAEYGDDSQIGTTLTNPVNATAVGRYFMFPEGLSFGSGCGPNFSYAHISKEQWFSFDNRDWIEAGEASGYLDPIPNPAGCYQMAIFDATQFVDQITGQDVYSENLVESVDPTAPAATHSMEICSGSGCTGYTTAVINHYYVFLDGYEVLDVNNENHAIAWPEQAASVIDGIESTINTNNTFTNQSDDWDLLVGFGSTWFGWPAAPTVQQLPAPGTTGPAGWSNIYDTANPASPSLWFYNDGRASAVDVTSASPTPEPTATPEKTPPPCRKQPCPLSPIYGG